MKFETVLFTAAFLVLALISLPESGDKEPAAQSENSQIADAAPAPTARRAATDQTDPSVEDDIRQASDAH